MGFPKNVSESVLVKSQRCCSICHKFCGTKIELHHIKQTAAGGPDTEDNCIALCFDCHADVKSYNPKHPKGHQYSEKELKMHRDKWYEKVSKLENLYDTTKYLDLEIATYRRLKELFDDDVQYFLSDLDFASSYFTSDNFDPLYKFCELCDKPDYEFIDSDLEILKQSLKSATAEFLHYLSIKTFPNGPNAFSVPMEWANEQPKKFEKIVRNLNEMANDVWQKYCDFIKSARRKLVTN